MNSSAVLPMIFYLLAWHYGPGLRKAAADAFSAFSGFVHYFSIPALFRTLFAPWHRIVGGYGRGFDIKTWAAALIGNLFSRILGAIARSTIILAGVAVSLAALLGGLVYIVFWLLAPFLALGLMLAGIAAALL